MRVVPGQLDVGDLVAVDRVALVQLQRRQRARLAGELQARLEASREDMIAWIRGAAMPPVAIFVKLVEILLDAAGLGRAPPV